MGWSNKIIAMSCALDMAKKRNMKLAVRNQSIFTSDQYPDLQINLGYFLGHGRGTENSFTDFQNGQTCDATVSWGEAYYEMLVNGSSWIGCPTYPMSPELLESGIQALESLGENNLPSLHLRNFEGWCADRFDMKAFVCTKAASPAEAIDNPCDPDIQSLAERHATKDFLVFSDGQDEDLEDLFPVVDFHDFFTQYAMMVQTPRHVGNVLSTVDLLVSRWREHVHGPGTTFPSGCYV
jgi:hypothetical protein